MLSEPEYPKVWVHLYGGAQDGYRCKIELKTKPSKKFYIWDVNDEATIEKVNEPHREVLQNLLATMAYEFFEEVASGGESELRYRRLESADKPVGR